MRFVLAISALVLSGIMLVLGIGQVTFLAGPQKVTYSEKFDAPNGLATLTSDQFSAVPGQPNVVIEGRDAFAAVGKKVDVDAWTAPFEHGRVSVNADKAQLSSKKVTQDSDAAEQFAKLTSAEGIQNLLPPSPYGSDLWQEQRGSTPQSAAGQTDNNVETVRLPVSPRDDQAVLVSAATSEAPAKLSIEWVQDRRTPWAGPLLAGGAVLAIVGALLYLLAVDHDRKGLGPRRGRRGPFLGLRNVLGRASKSRSSSSTSQDAKSSTMKRLITVPAMTVAGALALSGCAPSYWPDLSNTSESSQVTSEPSASATAPVPVSQAQVTRIVGDIAKLSQTADDALDTSGLNQRFVGDALTEREVNYKIRQSVPEYEVVVPKITTKELGYQLVQSTESWPRTVFVVVASESPQASATEPDKKQESPSLALIMTQENPFENFKVSRTIALRGGIKMPEAAPAEEGTALLSDDLATLRLTPAEVGKAYSAVLQGGAGVPEAETFNLDGDSLIERSGSAWVAQSTQAASASGQGITYSVAAAQSDAPLISLSTGVGGAFVATTVKETRTEQPGEGSRWRPTVPKSLGALSGLSGQQDKLVSVVAHQLLFYVPGKDSTDKIQLLGYTSDLVSASNS